MCLSGRKQCQPIKSVFSRLCQPATVRIFKANHRTWIFVSLNNIVGWVVFAVAPAPTGSPLKKPAAIGIVVSSLPHHIDCKCRTHLGAPFFLLLGRMFSFLSILRIPAKWVTIIWWAWLAAHSIILFLFWSITRCSANAKWWHKSRKPIRRTSLGIDGRVWSDSLAYTFSDSFWFSAGWGWGLRHVIILHRVCGGHSKVGCHEDESQQTAGSFLCFIWWACPLSAHVELGNAARSWLIYYFKNIKHHCGVHYSHAGH